jgi:hypothetical protein
MKPASLAHAFNPRSVLARALLGLLLAVVGVVWMRTNARAQSVRDPGQLCLRTMQWDAPDQCPAYGPGAQRETYWQTGLLPRRPFAGLPLDPALGVLDRSYALVNPKFALPVYRTLDAAMRNNEDHRLEKGFVYISYTQVFKRKDYSNQDKVYLETGGGWFIHKEDVTPSVVMEKQFHGLTLSDAPEHPFGWVIAQRGVSPATVPGGDTNTDATVVPYNGFVEAFSSQEVNGTTWYQIGLGQWLPAYQLGLVLPEPQPDGVPAGARWFSVNLAQQTFVAYEGDRMVFATLASTGMHGFWTKPGLFQIKKKWEMQSMSGAFQEDRSDFYFVEDVPYIMYFSSSRAIHGAYWHNGFGIPRSHGCVNLPVADAHWAFDFAAEGAWVHVFDPTGQTPTDEASYQWDGLAP